MEGHDQINQHIVPPSTPQARLSDYCVGIFPEIPSRKGTKKAISRGQIWVDGLRGSSGIWVKPGMCITLCELDREPTFIFQLTVPIVYEDDDIAIVNKPGGVPVSGSKSRTIENALLHNINPSNQKDGYKQPKAVHRLDAATCGLLLIAKTRSARMHLGQQFEQKSISKYYQALVCGQTMAEGTIDEAINQKSATTDFRLIKSVRSLHTDWLSWLELKPHTGRTHQLRIHLANAGFPILGDKKYGVSGEIMKGKGLFLCATALSFVHPSTNQTMSFSVPPPSKFGIHTEREQHRWEQFYLQRQA